MTAPFDVLPVVAGGLPDALGDVLTDVAYWFGGSVLVETESGAVIAHAVQPDEAPPAVARAVLSRSAARLAAALHSRRSVGVLPGGPVIRSSLAGWEGDVVTAPLTRAGQRIGWLWLLVPPGSWDVSSVGRAVVEVVRACPEVPGHDTDGPLIAALHGRARLPQALIRDAVQVRVAAVCAERPHVTTSEVRAAVTGARGRSRDWSVEVVSDGDVVQLLLLTDEPRAEDQAQLLLDRLLIEAEGVLGGRLLAGLSAAVTPDACLATATAQSCAALRWADAAHRCVPIQQVRAQVVLDLLGPVLDELPDLGSDPVACLLEQDSRRDKWLVSSLLAWCDAHGDCQAAAQQLGVHPNTLRYRLKAARRAISADLDDPAVRLEIHLRLRAMSRKDRT